VNIPLSFLTSSRLLLWWRAQSRIALQPSKLGGASTTSIMISMRRILSEKLLSLNANPKSESEEEALRE